MDTATLHIRMEDSLKNELEVEAKKLGLSISAYVRLLLIGEVKRDSKGGASE